jgi:hypothetical protein
VTLFGLSAAQLGALFAALALPLVGLYLLRMHRRRLEVPFVKLWERVLSERQPSRWWRRLQRLFSLLLQLLFAALVVVALGDPRLGTARRDARSVVIVLDCSASMQARDVAPSRLARAREEAQRVVRGMGGGDQALVVRMDAEPVPLTGWETDARTLERAIAAQQSSDTAADLDGALALADDALRGRTGPTVVVISDGALPVPTRPGTADLRFVQVGRSGVNVGITAFSVRRYPANKSSYEVLLEVVSHGDQPTQRKLTVEADGETVDVQTLELAPGEKTRRFYPNLSGASSRLVARLEPADDFPLDDTAYALLPPRKKQRVLVVTPGNLFLEGALLLEENVDLERIAPAAWRPGRGDGYDAVVLDRFAPPQPPRARGLLYLDPPEKGSPFVVRGQVARPFLTELYEGHPLLRWITLDDVNIAQAKVFALERGDVALASSLHQPIIVAGTRAASKVVAIGFDVRRSDLPMRVAFPVLLVGALDWFGGDDAQVLGTYRTGHAAQVPLAGAGDVAIADPQGERSGVTVGDDGRFTFFARRAGFHQVSGAGGEATLAANLADPAESDIRPRPLLSAGHAAPAPDLSGGGPRRRLWTLLVLAAAVLTAVEWLSYQRRWTV